jgi:hypothetical protein
VKTVQILNVVCMLYVYSMLAIYWRFSSIHITISISLVALQWEGVIAEMNQLLNVASALDIRVEVVVIM